MTTRPDISRPSPTKAPRYIQDIRPALSITYRAPRRRRFKRSFKIALALCLILFIGLPVLLLVQPWRASSGKTAGRVAEVPEQTLEEVAGISSDEKPVVLYVTDKTKVNQPFLEKAENGDEVRLYYQAKKAVLFRPSSGAVIATGDFTPPAAKVFLRQGTSNNAAMRQAEATLKLRQDVVLVSKDRSASQGYANTLVIDVSGRYTAQAQALAKTLGGTQAGLPANEMVPDADILIIVGGR
jgi:hypothetical protein